MTPDYPECARCLRIALRHIFGDATGAGAHVFPNASLPELTWCMAQPGVLQAEAHVHAVAATGDVPQTKGACQQWSRAYKLARQTYQQQRQVAA